MKFDREKFVFLYINQYGELKPSQLSGLQMLIDVLSLDEDVTDLRWAAYMLATVKHECAGTWQPIAEYGKGAGRKYGTPDEHGRVYYGRGYVQLTWKENYQAMSKVCGLDLVASPDSAMVPHIAYRIMSHGMRRGSFTGVGLGTYIYNDHCDYLHARKIINGMDCAEKIAGYATAIETMLRAAEITEAKEATP